MPMTEQERHEHFVATIDALAAKLHDPLAELANLLREPVPTINRPGEFLPDTVTLNDAGKPVPIVGRSRRRIKITIVNAGGITLLIGKADQPSISGAGTFSLLPGASITIATRDPVFVQTATPGAIVSWLTEEVAEQ